MVSQIGGLLSAPFQVRLQRVQLSFRNVSKAPFLNLTILENEERKKKAQVQSRQSCLLLQGEIAEYPTPHLNSPF